MGRIGLEVVGIGLNATDVIAQVQHFPAPGGKVHIQSIERRAGGQTATALVTCRRLGLRVRYIGRVGDDEAGRLQLTSLQQEGVDLRYLRVVPGATTQLGFIVVERRTGERTVFWHRDPRLAVPPSDLRGDYLGSAQVLHLDGCDVAVCLRAARQARHTGVRVVADLDTVYPNVDRLLPYIDYLLAAANFPPALTGIDDPFKSLSILSREYKISAAGMTLGRDGALVFREGRYYYSPGFVVDAVDTTGAGDVFHGGFIYGLVRGWPLQRVLDFANAMAALNCTALGARGGIAHETLAERLMATGQRRTNQQYVPPCSVSPQPDASVRTHRQRPLSKKP